jgi:hypothetical protein
MTTEQVLPELQRLIRGRGLRAGNAHHRVGPALTTLANVAQSDSSVQVNRKLIQVLTEAASRLPDDLQVAALTALGLHGPAETQYLQDRLSWLAETTEMSERTTRRRATTALRLLSEQLDELVKDARPQQGWHVSSLRVLLRMDVDPLQLVEDRVIVASADNLSEIEIRLSAPASRHQIDTPAAATILYGGEITRTEHITSSHHKYTVRLPTPLRAGEKHEYGTRFTGFPRALTPPFCVMTPLRPCERFTVRVRFGANIPSRIWRLDGIPPRAIEDFEPADALLTADRLGEVSLEFSRLHQGLSYGVRWETTGEPTGPRAAAESH